MSPIEVRTFDPGDPAGDRTVFAWRDRSNVFILATPSGACSRIYPLLLNRTARWTQWKRHNPRFINEPFFTEPL